VAQQRIDVDEDADSTSYLPPSEGGVSAERAAELVATLASVMQQSGVSELDLALGQLSVRMRRPTRTAADPDETMASLDGQVATRSESREHVITAPMIGTFYTSPTPGASPFVTEGDHVSLGQTIGIIEAMKIMNEIAADRSGIVQAVYAGNGQPVEYGSPLMLLGVGASGDRG
jgi:acetyl-CoA carboxylase biotin carboxyl carrier protein